MYSLYTRHPSEYQKYYQYRGLSMRLPSIHTLSPLSLIVLSAFLAAILAQSAPAQEDANSEADFESIEPEDDAAVAEENEAEPLEEKALEELEQEGEDRKEEEEYEGERTEEDREKEALEGWVAPEPEVGAEPLNEPPP